MRSLQRRWGLGSISVPTTIVSADRDRFFPPRTGEALARDIDQVRFLSTEGMHLWVLLDHEKLDEYVGNLRGGVS